MCKGPSCNNKEVAEYDAEELRVGLEDGSLGTNPGSATTGCLCGLGQVARFLCLGFLVLKQNGNNNTNAYFIALLRRLLGLIHTNRDSSGSVNVASCYDLTHNLYDNSIKQLLLPDEETEVCEDEVICSGLYRP